MLRVSIIIPTRNRSTLLLQALRSVFRQTWRNIEVIVVDEASTDDTISIIKGCFPQVILVKNIAPKGPSGARNAGIEISSGQYVLFLDDDDLLHPDHISALVAAAESKPANTAVSGRWRRFERIRADVVFSPIVCCPQGRSADATLAELLDPVGEGSICTHSVLWPRAILQRVKWDESLFTNGDVDFLGRVVLSGYAIEGCPVGMAYYRSHMGERVAGTPSERALISSMQYRIKWTQLLEKHPNRDLFRQAMQNGLISLILVWPDREENAQWLPVLEEAFRSWGGRRYYLPVPPRTPLKRLAANLALRIGGPSLLSRLLGLKRRDLQLPQIEYRGESSPDDMEDRRVVESLLTSR